nr:hypothetical protein [Erwinia sp. S43]
MEKEIALPCSHKTDVSRMRTEVPALPVSALLALAMTGFICIITETLPAGLLPQIAAGLNISNSLAGQTVTAIRQARVQTSRCR